MFTALHWDKITLVCIVMSKCTKEPCSSMWISDSPVNIYTHYINLITAVDLEGREDYDSKTICFQYCNSKYFLLSLY